MAVNRVRVNVHHHVLLEMNLPGGPVWSWTRGLVRQVEEVAQLDAPVRTGRLAAGISHSVTPVGPKGVQGTVTSSAPYTLFVHEGTSTIRPRNGKWLRLSPGWGPFNESFQRGVRGQNANPFLGRALGFVMRALH